jgi:uncharacterized protein (DUF2141 family)
MSAQTFSFVVLSLGAAMVGLVAGQAAAQTQPTVSPDRLEATIVDLRSDAGQVLCALHNSAENFPQHAEKAVQTTHASISGHRAVCVFPGLPPGTYALSVVHDENGNGKLDTNFLGIPREGVGASRDAQGHFGPPAFKDASFPYVHGVLPLTLHMKYF